MKHANRDTESQMRIDEQAAHEYLYAISQDFWRFSKTLHACNIIDFHPDIHKARKEGPYIELFRRAAHHITNNIGVFRQDLPTTGVPQIYILTNLIISWSDLIKEQAKSLVLKNEYNPNHSYVPSSLTEKDKRAIIKLTNKVAYNYLANNEIFDFIKLKLGRLTKEEFNKARQGRDMILLNLLRQETKPYMNMIVGKELSKYEWVGAGYYIKGKGTVPINSGLTVDPDGIDFLPAKHLK